jgi:hypothetical protein
MVKHEVSQKTCGDFCPWRSAALRNAVRSRIQGSSRELAVFFDELLHPIALFAEHKCILQLLGIEQRREFGQQLHDLVCSDREI